MAGLMFLKNKHDALGTGWSLIFTRYLPAELFQMVAANNYYQNTNLDFLKRAATQRPAGLAAQH